MRWLDVDVCISGCLEYGEEFAHKFITTTHGWNNAWLNERETARRPWIHFPEFKEVDAILNEHNLLVSRKLDVAFAGEVFRSRL